MKPFHIIPIGIFLLMLTACEERDDHGFYSPHEPRELPTGVYSGKALYNNGADTLAIMLVYNSRHEAELFCPGVMYSAASNMAFFYDTYSYEGAVRGFGMYITILYDFFYNGDSMTGYMELGYYYKQDRISIDTTVTLTLRGDG